MPLEVRNGKGSLDIGLPRADLGESDLFDPAAASATGPSLRSCVSNTGIGRAGVNGIVERHDRSLSVQSEPGKSTTFNIYIPETEDSSSAIVETGEVPPAGVKRILLIDDEQTLVELGTEILTRLGYQVTPVTDSMHALEIFRSRPSEFDLVITDYTMPKLTGAELSEEVHRIRPDIAIILSTGFSEKITEQIANDLGVGLILKPFGLKQLAELVREVLDEKQNKAGVDVHLRM